MGYRTIIVGVGSTAFELNGEGLGFWIVMAALDGRGILDVGEFHKLCRCIAGYHETNTLVGKIPYCRENYKCEDGEGHGVV